MVGCQLCGRGNLYGIVGFGPITQTCFLVFVLPSFFLVFFFFWLGCYFLSYIAWLEEEKCA